MTNKIIIPFPESKSIQQIEDALQAINETFGLEGYISIEEYKVYQEAQDKGMRRFSHGH